MNENVIQANVCIPGICIVKALTLTTYMDRNVLNSLGTPVWQLYDAYMFLTVYC